MTPAIDDHAALHELLDRLFAAWNARDAAAFAALFAEDADYVTGAGEPWRGRRMIEGEIAARFDTGGEAVGVARLAASTIRHIAPEVAIARASWTLSTGSGPARERRGVSSVVAVREPGGGWRIALLHNTDVAVEQE